MNNPQGLINSVKYRRLSEIIHDISAEAVIGIPLLSIGGVLRHGVIAEARYRPRHLRRGGPTFDGTAPSCLARRVEGLEGGPEMIRNREASNLIALVSRCDELLYLASRSCRRRGRTRFDLR